MSGSIAGIVAANNNLKIDIYERQDSILKKILLTGNGRCNISNESIDTGDYITSAPDLLSIYLDNFDRQAEARFFNQLGIYTRSKNGGLYPCTNQAVTVRNTLVNLLEQKKVNIITEAYIDNIKVAGTKYVINDKAYDYCILACGGMAGVYKESELNGYQILKNLAIRYGFCYPGLVQVKCKSDIYKGLKGIRFDGQVTLTSDGETVAVDKGEVQITENGLSGIVIFQHSRYIGALLREKHSLTFEIDLLYDFADTELIANLEAAKGSFGDLILIDYLSSYVNSRILLSISELEGVINKSLKDISVEDFLRVVSILRCWRHNIKELNPYKNAQVSVGGLELTKLTDSFMLKSHHNLFVTGEMVDATGKCGGYNLHFATLSGFLSGQYIKKDSSNASN